MCSASVRGMASAIALMWKPWQIWGDFQEVGFAIMAAGSGFGESWRLCRETVSARPAGHCCVAHLAAYLWNEDFPPLLSSSRPFQPASPSPKLQEQGISSATSTSNER